MRWSCGISSTESAISADDIGRRSNRRPRSSRLAHGPEQLGLAQQLVLAFELALFLLAGALVCQARFDFAAGSLRCAVGAKVCLRLVEALGDSGVPLGLV